MKFLIYKTSGDIEKGIVREINTLSELLEFLKKSKNPLIIDENDFYNALKERGMIKSEEEEKANTKFTIEIYDDYRE